MEADLGYKMVNVTKDQVKLRCKDLMSAKRAAAMLDVDYNVS